MEPCILAHHWIIDAAPKRGSYHATCKNCGEERDFQGYNGPGKFRMTRSAVAPPVTEKVPGSPTDAGARIPRVDAIAPPGDVPMPAAEEATSG